MQNTLQGAETEDAGTGALRQAARGHTLVSKQTAMSQV